MAKKTRSTKRSSKKTASRKMPSTKKKSATRKKTTSSRSKSSSSQIEAMSTQEIQRHLQSRERRIRSLERKRERILGKIAEVDEELAQHAGRIPGAGGRRPRNEQNLSDALVDVLNGREMNVTDAAEEVKRSGYMTTAANFRTIVNQKLITDKRFKKVRRGVYTVK